MIKVLIADDQELIRQSLSIVLNTKEGIEVTDTVANGQEVIASVRKNRPDVILMDIRMPKMDGVQCTKIIKDNYSEIKIIILTTFDDDEYVYNALKWGASGYLLKPTTYEKLCSLLNDCKQAFHYEPESIIVKTDKGYRKIYYHLIECVEAQNKKVLFCLNDGECLEVLDTFVHCSNELTTNDAFYKCHRSYLVHMPAIDHFNSIEIETKTHKKVPIARSYAKSFKEAYFEYMFKEGD